MVSTTVGHNLGDATYLASMSQKKQQGESADRF
jgi:hypothetical protein